VRIVLGIMQPISPRQQATVSIVISILELDNYGARNLFAVGLTGKIPQLQRRSIVKQESSQPDNLIYLVQPPYKRAK
jgi:hypothetical protein